MVVVQRQQALSKFEVMTDLRNRSPKSGVFCPLFVLTTTASLSGPQSYGIWYSARSFILYLVLKSLEDIELLQGLYRSLTPCHKVCYARRNPRFINRIAHLELLYSLYSENIRTMAVLSSFDTDLPVIDGQ